MGQEDPLEEAMTTHSRILAWNTPWTEEPGGLLTQGSIYFLTNVSVVSSPPWGPLLGRLCSGSQRERGKKVEDCVRYFRGQAGMWCTSF